MASHESNASLFPIKIRHICVIWGGAAYNATSVYGLQLPSTVDNFRQHLLHHNTLFVAFIMNELIMAMHLTSVLINVKHIYRGLP